jgi:molecular chaperone IbpA
LNINDVDIEVSDGQLVVRSAFDDKAKVFNGEFIHRGISFKKFTRPFTLADDIEVTGANLKNGLLTIDLTRIVPEEKKPKKITIECGSPNDKQFLAG